MRKHAPARDSVARDTPVQVLAAVGSWYRIQLLDGPTGYVPAARVAAAASDASRMPVDREVGVTRDAGTAGATAEPVALLAPGDTVAVLGRFGALLLIRTPRGVQGWIPQPLPVRPAAD